MLGITNIAVFAGKKFRSIQVIVKKVIRAKMIGFAKNVSKNIFGDKKTDNRAYHKPYTS